MKAAFDKAGFGDITSVSRGGVAGIFADPDGIELQFLPAPDTLVTVAVPSQLVEWNQGMLTPKGVDHALLKVSDMKKALQFYRTLYGRKDYRDKKKPGRVWFPIGPTRLGLEEVAVPVRRQAAHRALRHPGRAVRPRSRDGRPAQAGSGNPAVGR